MARGSRIKADQHADQELRKRKGERIFYIDWAMCGGEELPPDFEIEESWQALQGKLAEVEIVPVADPKQCAMNLEPSLLPATVFTEALGEYCQR